MTARSYALTAVAFAVFSIATNSAFASDCSISERFRVKRPQHLTGVLQDSTNAVLPGIELELLSQSQLSKHLRTGNDGSYDFGELLTGTYQVHIGREGFCAPKTKCQFDLCVLSTATLDSNHMTAVY